MKYITLRIPENKYSFFMELLKNFDYVKVEENDMEIPEEHKIIVRQRTKASKDDPSRLLNWDEAKHKLKV
jgi:hypothetical protein